MSILHHPMSGVDYPAAGTCEKALSERYLRKRVTWNMDIIWSVSKLNSKNRVTFDILTIALVTGTYFHVQLTPNLAKVLSIEEIITSCYMNWLNKMVVLSKRFMCIHILLSMFIYMLRLVFERFLWPNCTVKISADRNNK